MNKVLLGILIGAFLFPVTGHAETLSEALLKCSREQNSLKRLVCFDSVTKDVKQYEDGDRPSFVIPSYRLSDNNAQQVASAPVPQAPAPQTPAPQAVAPTNPAPTPAQAPGVYSDEEYFGLPNELNSDNIKKLYMTITKLREGPRERLIFTFNNGQVWRQTDYERFRVDVGDVVYVERGAVGSFWLSSDNIRRRIKVKRDNNKSKERVASQQAAPRSTTVYAQSTPPVAENGDDDANFGLPGSADNARDIKVYMTVADAIEGKDDRLTVVFENGQIWKQTDTTKINIKAGEIAYVEGSSGSFWLSTDDTEKRIQVRRQDRGNRQVQRDS